MSAADAKDDELPLPNLDYAYDALEPFIDEATMRVHHLKHHEAYRSNLNAALKTLRERGAEGRALASRGIDEILTELDKAPEDLRSALRNHGGGYVNHALFWKLLAPKGPSSEVPQPKGELAAAINAEFGSFDQFKKEFSQKALTLFGSGWAWLYYDIASKKLVVSSTGNQDTPAMEKGRVPILTLDVWEHAYYLKYQNKRVDYISGWWNIINWPFAEALFHRATHAHSNL